MDGPMDGWWIVANTDDGEVYEGWFKDQIDNTVIIEIEPGKRHGISWHEVTILNAYRTKPEDDRCPHGVWVGERCFECERTPSPI